MEKVGQSFFIIYLLIWHFLFSATFIRLKVNPSGNKWRFFWKKIAVVNFSEKLLIFHFRILGVLVQLFSARFLTVLRKNGWSDGSTWSRKRKTDNIFCTCVSELYVMWWLYKKRSSRWKSRKNDDVMLMTISDGHKKIDDDNDDNDCISNDAALFSFFFIICYCCSA